MTTSTINSKDSIELLAKTVKRALSDRERFDRQLCNYGLHVENFDRVVVSILTDFLPAGPCAPGGVVPISAEQVYSQLSDADKSVIRELYEDVIAEKRWKRVPSVQWVGPGTLDSRALREVARFRFNFQYGGLKRFAFLDATPARIEQIRKNVAAYRPDSIKETMPQEVCEKSVAIQQILSSEKSPQQGATIDWK